MAKKKNYYYVLVFTPNGPVYVTDVEWSSKTAHWDKDKKPEEMTECVAKDLVFGLCCNFYSAVVVNAPYELDHQPYNYESYDIRFEEKGESKNER